MDLLRYGERRVFCTTEAVKDFINECERTHVDWSLKTGEFWDGELVTGRKPLTSCQFIDEDGGIEAVLGRLEAA